MPRQLPAEPTRPPKPPTLQEAPAAKRPIDTTDEASTHAAPIPPKRRKTNEDDGEEAHVRPTMAPPIRQSTLLRRDGLKASVFGSTHVRAPSLLKTATVHQTLNHQPITSIHQPIASAHQPGTTAQQSSSQASAHQPGTSIRTVNADMSKYRDGNRIPFAEPAPNQLFKTPLPAKLPHSQQYGNLHNQLVAKPQSPQYVNGENIQLAEIPTDSEDEDQSDYTPDAKNAAQKRSKTASLPDWAQSPQLRELLEQQEDLLDADAVFGPVASPHMEEMFRERHHRFRSRTSSANWAGSDRLTEEEIRRDIEARARLRRDGGWTFGL